MAFRSGFIAIVRTNVEIHPAEPSDGRGYHVESPDHGHTIGTVVTRDDFQMVCGHPGIHRQNKLGVFMTKSSWRPWTMWISYCTW